MIVPRSLFPSLTLTVDSTTSPLTINVTSLPYGGPNARPATTLTTSITSLLSSFPSSSAPDFSFASLLSSSLLPVCGNGVCEIGERPNPALGYAGCSVDCPFPVVTCPFANGKQCNGEGVCVPGSSGACPLTVRARVCVCPRSRLRVYACFGRRLAHVNV